MRRGIHARMSQTIHDFRFPKTMRAWDRSKIMTPNGWEFKDQSMETLIQKSFSDLPEFMSLFLRSNYGKVMDMLEAKHGLPGERFDPNRIKEAGKPAYDEFNSPEGRKALREDNEARHFTIYPLSADELERSNSFIAENPEFAQAVICIQACLKTYMDRLRSELMLDNYMSYERVVEGRANTLEVGFHKLRNEASGFSFIHDLLPVMAYSLSQTQTQTQPQAIDEPALGFALCEAFRYQAFKSRDKSEVVCPFSAAITKIFSMRIERDAAGNIQIRERQKPGALIHSMIAFLATEQAVKEHGQGAPGVEASIINSATL